MIDDGINAVWDLVEQLRKAEREKRESMEVGPEMAPVSLPITQPKNRPLELWCGSCREIYYANNLESSCMKCLMELNNDPLTKESIGSVYK